MRAIILFSIFVSCHELAICPGCRHTFALKTAGTGSEGTCPPLPHHNRSQEKKFTNIEGVNMLIVEWFTSFTPESPLSSNVFIFTCVLCSPEIPHCYQKTNKQKQRNPHSEAGTSHCFSARLRPTPVTQQFGERSGRLTISSLIQDLSPFVCLYVAAFGFSRLPPSCPSSRSAPIPQLSPATIYL